jgi:sulfur carrier protein ThiS
MIRMILSSPLFDLLPEEERASCASRRVVNLEADSWREVVREVRERFPKLSEHVLTDSGQVAPGFALVVNDEVMPRHAASAAVRGGDEIALIAAIAGG